MMNVGEIEGEVVADVEAVSSKLDMTPISQENFPENLAENSQEHSQDNSQANFEPNSTQNSQLPIPACEPSSEWSAVPTKWSAVVPAVVQNTQHVITTTPNVCEIKEKFKLPCQNRASVTPLGSISDDIRNGYYRQIKHSPDDLCFSVTKNDEKVLKIYNFANENEIEREAAITIPHGYTVYDHAWYPFLNSARPETCLILSCSAGPGSCARLYDAYSTGELKASYVVYNQYVEPVAVNSVAFSTCGGYVYTGRDKTINCFPIDRPNAKSSFTLGTKPDNVPKKSIKADYKAKHMLHGIQSTIAPHPKSFYLLATGSYSGQLALLDARLNKIPARVDTAHPRGITQVKWLNEWQILSGARKGDSSIRLWDLRYLDKDNPALDFSVCDYTGSSLEASSLFMRDVQTHQKIEFDVMQNRYVVTGLPSGGYRVFDTKTTEFVSQGVDFKENCDNSSVVSVSVPNYPESDCTKILSVSGERQLPRFDEFVDSDDEGMSFEVPKSCNQIRLDKLNFDLIN